MDDAPAGERQRALVHDLRRAVLRDVLHDHDHAACAVHEVHRAARALDHLAGDHPVREVARCRHLHGAEDRGVDLAAADHAEARRASRRTPRPGSTVTVSLPALMRSGSTSSSVGYGPTPRMPFSRLQHDLDARRARSSGRGSAGRCRGSRRSRRASSRGGAGRHLIAGERHLSSLSRTVRRSMRFSTSRRPRPRGGRRCRAGARRRGRARPVSTSSSTSAMQTRPAMAASGLKLRADLSNTRLPWRSPFSACTSAKSLVIASSSTNSRLARELEGLHLLRLARDARSSVGVRTAAAVRPRRPACRRRSA